MLKITPAGGRTPPPLLTAHAQGENADQVLCTWCNRLAAWGCPVGWNLLIRNWIKECLLWYVVCMLGGNIPRAAGDAMNHRITES